MIIGHEDINIIHQINANTSVSSPFFVRNVQEVYTLDLGLVITGSGMLVDGSNKLLIASTSYWPWTPTDNCTGMSFNGNQYFTLLTGSNSETDASVRTEMWYLVNPTSTTANCVSYYNGGIREMANCYALYNNAFQGAPVNPVSGYSPSLSVTINVVNSSSTDLIIDAFGTYAANNAPVTSGAGQINAGVTNKHVGFESLYTSYKPATGNFTTMFWTDNGANITCGSVGCAIKGV